MRSEFSEGLFCGGFLTAITLTIAFSWVTIHINNSWRHEAVENNAAHWAIENHEKVFRWGPEPTAKVSD